MRALALLLLAAMGCAGEQSEGRPWIHRVRLVGARHVDQDELKSRLSMQGRSWWPLSHKPYLNPFDVEIDARRVESYYHERGYFDVRIVDTSVHPHGKDAVDVTLGVEEGQPTWISGVELSGVSARAAGKLRLAAGQRFDYEKYQAEKDRISGALKRRGYAWAEVEGEVQVDRDARRALIRLRVNAGPPARFGTLTVRGTSRISPARLRHYAALPAGRRFSPRVLDDLRGHVYQLGLFAAVRVDYQHSAGHPEIADVILTVQEGTFRELRISAGIGVESQRNELHASVAYTRRNFLGGLRSLRLRLMPAYVAIPAVWNIERQGPAGTIDATLTQPDLFWRTELRVSIGLDLGIDYAYQFWGPRGQLALARDLWGRRAHVELGYNFQYLNFFNTDPAILDQPNLAGPLYGFVDPYRLGWLQEDLQLDLRDRPLDPTRGGWLGLSAEEGGAYTLAAFQYQKLLPEARGYAPLGTKRVVAAARVQFGQIFVQGDLGSPVTRRFRLGGPGSHRGFNYDRLSPQIPSGLKNVQPLPIGGDQMFLAQLELRVSLFRLYGNWLALAAFTDGGDVAAPSCPTSACRDATVGLRRNIDFADLHWAVGGGLRYKTLLGTVRFDVGVRLNRLSPTEANGEPNPDPGQRMAYHLSVGEAF